MAKAYALYTKDSYKEAFGWVDRISSVKAPGLVAELEARAVELINADDPSVWLVVPEVINWESIAGFRVGNAGDLKDDILLGDVLEALGGNGLTDFAQLKKIHIDGIGEADGSVIYRWPASKCLYGELRHNGLVYCASGGRWYGIEEAYRDIIETNYRKTVVSSIDFPECSEDKESKYNCKLAEIGGSHRALMDTKIVNYGNGHSQIELCDVLCDAGTYVHVKFYSGSFMLSHLFNQGLVSASLVKSDGDFRAKADKKVQLTSPGFGLKIDPDSLKEVVYGIITKDAGDLPQIPFFSKVTFDYVKRQYSLMGVAVSIKAIHRVTA